MPDNDQAVTQADREAAADYLIAAYPEAVRDARVRKLREGTNDNDPAVQHFARHRIAASTGERDAEGLRTLAKANNDLARMNGLHRDEWRAAAVGLAEALEPFAREADAQERVTSFSSGDVTLPRTKITIGELRRARVALAALPEHKGAE